MKLQHKPPTLRSFVGRSERSDLRQIAKKPTITQQIKKLPKLIFFNHKKPMKTTHKPIQVLTLYQFYQKLPLCQN